MDFVDAGPPDGGACVPAAPGEYGVAACTNGIDDDCDGQIDCADNDCSAVPGSTECCNGRDDNANGFVDEFACRCFSDSMCTAIGNTGGDVCWTATFSACAPRCNFFGGTTACQMFLPGTTCDLTSGQCH